MLKILRAMETLLLSIIQTYKFNSFACFTLPLHHYNLLLAVSSAVSREKEGQTQGKPPWRTEGADRRVTSNF